ELDRDVRIVELGVGGVDRVAHEDELFASVFENVIGVARRVAVRRKRTYSRKELGRTIESLHVAGGRIGTYRRFHLLVKTLGRLGIVLAGGLVRPEIELSPVH